MLCEKCGQLIPDGVNRCPACGYSIPDSDGSAADNDVQVNMEYYDMDQNSEIKTYLFPSVFVTMLCCNLLGVIAIYHAGKVSTLLALQRYDEARAESSAAKKWVIITFILGILLYMLAVVISVVLVSQILRTIAR